MSKEMLNALTGELFDVTKVQPVTVVESIKFRTNYTDNTVDNDAEINSGEYIIDDSQYIDFKKLLQRSAQCSKNPHQGVADFLSQFPVVDNVGGIDEKDLQNVINNNETEVSEVSSNELSTGATERPQESGEVANPVENSTDGVSVAEPNGQNE